MIGEPSTSVTDDSEPLPPGWSTGTDAEGRTFYIDHTNQVGCASPLIAFYVPALWILLRNYVMLIKINYFTFVSTQYEFLWKKLIFLKFRSNIHDCWNIHLY